jgi:hypothetical protein
VNTKHIQIEKLVEDMDFYPRNDVSGTVIASLVDAIHCGTTLPPIVVDKKSMRIVDGWHRYRAYKRIKADTIECDLRSYSSDAEMFRAAVELNAGHGRRFDTYDLRRSIIRMQELGLEMLSISTAIRVPAIRIEELLRGTARDSSETAIPLKRGLMHLSQTVLTKTQQTAVERSSGMEAVYHCNQLINLIEHDIAPLTDSFEAAMDRLTELWGQRIANR